MAQAEFKEGRVPFKIPSRDTPCETYYRIYGDLHNGVPPLVILHGGPGAGHEYMQPFSDLVTRNGSAVIFYDQIGCASSTHLRETEGDHSFWVPDLFVAELENLLRHLGVGGGEGLAFDVLGHSWGGTLAANFASRQPRGLRKLVLANANAASQLLKQNIWELKTRLAPEHQKAIEEALEKDDFTLPSYLDAMKVFMSTFLCRGRPYPPPPLALNNKNFAEDMTVRRSMQGRSPFLYNGSLEHYSNIPLLPKIKVPTLVYYGEFDTATYRSTVPFFDHIPRVRWTMLNGASHMPHLDSEEMLEKTLQLVGQFLQQSPATVADT